jgi:chaperone modulatory protein CbpM
MSNNVSATVHAVIVEEEIHLTLIELCQACRAREEQITEWVMEGVLEPIGERAQEWRFTGRALQRARLASRLARDLEVNAAGIALALDLMDQIASLQAQLQRRAMRG